MPHDPPREPLSLTQDSKVSGLLAQESSDIHGPWTRLDCPARRIRWVLALDGVSDATAGSRESVASSSLLSVEGGRVEGDSSGVSLPAASQAEDASPVTGPITADEIHDMIAGDEFGLLDVSPFRHLSRCDSGLSARPASARWRRTSCASWATT